MAVVSVSLVGSGHLCLVASGSSPLLLQLVGHPQCPYRPQTLEKNKVFLCYKSVRNTHNNQCHEDKHQNSKSNLYNSTMV